MNKHTRIKAFTLIEVLITMIISSIVIAFALWSYNNILSYLHRYKQNEAQNQETVLFLGLFNTDFNQANTIKYDRDELVLEYINQSPIYYDFYYDYCIRSTQNISDTLQINIFDIDCIKETISNTYVSDFYFTLALSDADYPMHYMKFYTPLQLYNWHAN